MIKEVLEYMEKNQKRSEVKKKKKKIERKKKKENRKKKKRTKKNEPPAKRKNKWQQGPNHPSLRDYGKKGRKTGQKKGYRNSKQMKTCDDNKLN